MRCGPLTASRSPARRLHASRRVGLTLASLVALLASIAGCGGSGTTESSGGEKASGPVKVDVGVIPIADVAPLFLGKDKGFFQKRGIKIETHFAQGGAAIIPSVLSGDYQFGFSNSVSLMIGNAKGLPLRILAPGSKGAAQASQAWSKLLVQGDGPISSATDLEGKKVGVLTLKNIGHLVTKTHLDERGVDVSKVKFVEVPPPEMPKALGSGKVAAIAVVEPFLTKAQNAGARALFPTYAGGVFDAPMEVAPYFTTSPYKQKHPKVVKRFAKAMSHAEEYAADHPQQAREIIPTYTEISPELANKIKLPHWGSELNRTSLRQLAQRAQKYEFLPKAPDLQELIDG